MAHENAEAEILAREREALDRWSSGDPVGYMVNAAEDVTYYDDIGAQSLVVGREAVRTYLGGLEGQLPEHRYEVIDARVQVYGDVGVLTQRYQPSSLEGEALQGWKATCVYRWDGGAWQVVHAHWSMV